MDREVERFRAVSDDGKEYTVIKYQRFTEDRDLSGSTSIRQHLPELRLADGSRVNQIDPETFKIVETNEIIRKVH